MNFGPPQDPTKFDWMGWLNQQGLGQPGGQMGAGGMPQAGGMPAPGQPMGGGGMPPPPGGMPPPPGSAGPGPVSAAGMGPGLKMPSGGLPTPGLGGGGAPPGGGAPAGAQGTPMSARDQAMLGLYGELGALQPEQAKITRQRALADQLRKGAAMPQMRHEAVASHPLEFLSSLAHAGAAAYKGSQADEMADTLGGKENLIYKALADRYRTQG